MRVKEVLYSTMISSANRKSLDVVKRMSRSSKVGIFLPSSNTLVVDFSKTYFAKQNSSLYPILDFNYHDSAVYDSSGNLIYNEAFVRHIKRTGIATEVFGHSNEVKKFLAAYVEYVFYSSCAYSVRDITAIILPTMSQDIVDACYQDNDAIHEMLNGAYQAVNNVLGGALAYLAEYCNTEDGSYAVIDTIISNGTFHIVRTDDRRIMDWRKMTKKAREKAIQESLHEAEEEEKQIENKINS